MHYNHKRPLITVVVAVYNGENTIQRCIDSLVEQTYLHKELIFIDGASSDTTCSILEKNDQFINNWVSEPDKGIAHAWNKALGHSNGDWVLFLGADDQLCDKYVLSEIAEILCENKVDDVVFGKIVFVGGAFNGKIVGSPFKQSAMKKRMIIPHTAAFHRKSFFDDVGLFDQTLKMAMDYEILLRKKVMSVSFVDRRVTVMAGDGVSTRLIKQTLLEGRVAQLKNKVDTRLKIEIWHAFYQIRNLFNSWRK